MMLDTIEHGKLVSVTHVLVSGVSQAQVSNDK